jgi:hypothetical protein
MKPIFVLWCVVIALCVTRDCRGEIDTVSLWIGGSSSHSAGKNAEEKQHNQGFCVDVFCYMTFENSFHNPGSAIFINVELLRIIFGRNWLKFGFNNGLRFGIISGYMPWLSKKDNIFGLEERDNIPFLMGYVGVGYLSLPVGIWSEVTLIPDPQLLTPNSQRTINYVYISMIRLEIFNVKW